ncbi:hypothetical protein Pelo_14474 [Pelomyxa schiedti]|nr:hypothetical protein Pelo_14474 [Pelomyxa schiedti]
MVCSHAICACGFVVAIATLICCQDSTDTVVAVHAQETPVVGTDAQPIEPVREASEAQSPKGLLGEGDEVAGPGLADVGVDVNEAPPASGVVAGTEAGGGGDYGAVGRGEDQPQLPQGVISKKSQDYGTAEAEDTGFKCVTDEACEPTSTATGPQAPTDVRLPPVFGSPEAFDRGIYRLYESVVLKEHRGDLVPEKQDGTAPSIGKPQNTIAEPKVVEDVINLMEEVVESAKFLSEVEEQLAHLMLSVESSEPKVDFVSSIQDIEGRIAKTKVDVQSITSESGSITAEIEKAHASIDSLQQDLVKSEEISQALADFLSPKHSTFKHLFYLILLALVAGALGASYWAGQPLIRRILVRTTLRN